MDTEIQKQIEIAKTLKPVIGMTPSVFKAKMLDGEVMIGHNFQPVGVKVGDRFHIDHGAGIDINNDAEVIWIQ